MMQPVPIHRPANSRANQSTQSGQKMGMLHLNVVEPDDDIDLSFYHLQLQRQQQVIKSGLSLAIIQICNALNKDSPF